MPPLRRSKRPAFDGVFDFKIKTPFFKPTLPRKRDAKLVRSERSAFNDAFDFKIKSPFFKKTLPANATPVLPSAFSASRLLFFPFLRDREINRYVPRPYRFRKNVGRRFLR